MSLKSIAEKVGVSVSTVSRTLNDPEYRCSSTEIRDRIWEEARKEHYVPNEAAKNLKLKNNTLDKKVSYINILITRSDGANSDPFFSELFRSLQGELHKSYCILGNVWYVSEFSDERKVKGMNLSRTIDKLYKNEETENDGLIIIGKCAIDVIRLLQKKCKNIVSINRNSTNYTVDEVLCDGRSIAKEATRYLIGLGHSEIGYIGACHHESRYRGFSDALTESNLDLVPGYVIETNQTEKEGFEALQTLFEAEAKPTAIFCANDITAIGALKFIALHRKNGGYYPSIISCDDIEEARLFKPSLTTFHLDKEEMARHALYLLLDRIKGGHRSVVRLEVESHLIVRETCWSRE